MRGHIARLASEEFGGRKPGSDGEELKLAYIEGELSRAGYVSGTNATCNFCRATVLLVRTTPAHWRTETLSYRILTPLPFMLVLAYTGGPRAHIGRSAYRHDGQ